MAQLLRKTNLARFSARPDLERSLTKTKIETGSSHPLVNVGTYRTLFVPKALFTPVTTKVTRFPRPNRSDEVPRVRLSVFVPRGRRL